uniref:Uncharacterized protein n=1 Tax=Pyxicephalus adspersus TaxID=30357 RepID=A0AAV3AW28_PYXAD|nr:TPA: hypothetical protein GDO54_007882 [Pyxicephalus adspersus]
MNHSRCVSPVATRGHCVQGRKKSQHCRLLQSYLQTHHSLLIHLYCTLYSLMSPGPPFPQRVIRLFAPFQGQHSSFILFSGYLKTMIAVLSPPGRFCPTTPTMCNKGVTQKSFIPVNLQREDGEYSIHLLHFVSKESQ